MSHPAPVPRDEKERLDALYLLGLLDTATEIRFDRITQLAADLFDVPIALVSLVDNKRQWFKSACGLNLRETDRDASFCAHAILEPELLEIPDMLADPRFAENPLVVGPPHTRFYAGGVLRSASGHALGTLCILDRRPRTLSARSRVRLLALAGVVEQELQNEERLQAVREQAYHSAYLDADSGLPNARHFRDRAQASLDLARCTSASLTVALVDLVNVDAVAALLDDIRPEDLIGGCGARIAQALNPSCTVARWRGNVLAVLLPPVGARDAPVVPFLESLDKMFDTPFAIAGRQLRLEARIGAATYPEAGADAEALLRQAGLASCGAAPGTSHRRYTLYTPQLRHSMKRRLTLEQQLHDGLSSGSVSMVYQPIVDLQTGALSHLEALARWDAPDVGAISTEEFIALAERSHLILELDEFALRDALQAHTSWIASGAGMVKVAVNLSARTLMQESFVSWLDAHTRAAGVEPRMLTLEVTENCLVADMGRARANIGAARERGYRFSIDDFGTGFSSFEYVKTLAVDQIKLDRAFVREMTERSSDAAIAKSIINMARDLGLDVVAEGVETYEQLVYLQAYGCRAYQGYFYSPPVSATGVENLLFGR